MQQENLELVRKLAAQEEALSYSNRQLDLRSSECQALNRQLEAALSDVREQVSLSSCAAFVQYLLPAIYEAITQTNDQ